MEHEHNKVIECKRCVLTSKNVENITFDEDGVCKYCRYYDKVVNDLGDKTKRTNWIQNKIAEIKKSGKGQKYDCILGVSGGIDSSYLAFWAKQNGLRPLIVHFDNGWNSELATENIRNICEKLDLELNTYVINWAEFKEMQLAYIKAGVIDIEALTDHAIMTTIYKIAVKYKIKYTLNGFNYATEAIMPKGWVFDKSDWENIKDIYQKFGTGKSIKSFPHLSFYKRLYYHLFLKLESIQVLNYIPYSKQQAKETITNQFSWRDYGGKHYESVFTKFYQAYILPTRFKVDKRLAHLSSLICSEQITKEEAIKELSKPLYKESELKQEKEYVLKKLGMDEAEFDKLMIEPARKHEEFKTEQILWKRYFKLIKILKLKFK
ncbi:MAG: N-acetyl sugar amidotransferase [Bacteroidetes bacterium]|nr:N-acetyl sugar amidotransferase [Bacteroidota bacterium]